MVTYYVKKGEVYKVSATVTCDIYDGNGDIFNSCEAGSFVTFNAPTAKIVVSDGNAVLTCLSEVSGDLSGLSEHVNNSSVHTTPTDKSRWNSVAGDLSDVENHIDDSDIHVTSNEKNSWTTSSNELSTIKTQIGGFAPLNSPSFTGTPSAPTASTGTSNGQIATTLFVHTVASSKQDKKIGTANRVLVTDSEGNIVASSDIDTTELGYLDGVSSNIQAQLNTKQATISGAATTIVSSNLSTSRALVSNSSGKVAVSAVTATELGYLDGAKSNIQTQLNTLSSEIQTQVGNVTTTIEEGLEAKQNKITGGASTIVTSNLTATRALISNANGKVAVSPVTSTELSYLDGATSNVQTQLNNRQRFLNYSAITYFPTTVSSWYSISGVTAESQRKVTVAKDSIVILQAHPYFDVNAPTTTNKVLFDIYVDGTCVISGLSVTGGGSSSYQFPLKANHTLMWKLQATDNTIRLDCKAIIIPFED